MNLHIRPFSPDDMEEVVQLSLLAWTPVYHSFEQVLGTKIYSLVSPQNPCRFDPITNRVETLPL
jgi:hypothetical protein